jgi:WD40 repeat protein
MIPINDPGVAVAFSPDGGTLATGGIDGTVRLWHVGTRRQVAVLGRHGGQVLGLAFAPDGTLASGGADRQLRLWDVANRRQYGSAVALPGATSDGTELAFSTDSRTLYAVAADEVQRWDVASVRTYQGPTPPPSGPVGTGSPTP